MNRPLHIVAVVLAWLTIGTLVRAAVLPLGVLGDDQTSIVYYPETGELAVDAPTVRELTSIVIDSESCIFLAELLEVDSLSCDIFWAKSVEFPPSIITFGPAAHAGLSEVTIRNDLTVIGSLAGGFGLGPVDLVYMHPLFPGDANRDFTFDQRDIVQVMQRTKYLTGQPATWGDGDWSGGPGGYPGEPPVGDGVFNQLDIVAAQQAGIYLSGAYPAVQPYGRIGDEQTSIVYDPSTGAVGRSRRWNYHVLAHGRAVTCQPARGRRLDR